MDNYGIFIEKAWNSNMLALVETLAGFENTGFQHETTTWFLYPDSTLLGNRNHAKLVS